MSGELLVLKTPEVESGSDALDIARQRRSPRFVIMDATAQIVMTSVEPSDHAIAALARTNALAAKLIAQIQRSHDYEVFALLSPTIVLRMTTLSGRSEPFFALFIENVESRDLLANASTRYGLSTREIDVLRLVLHGMGTSEIASQLCIAATTVHAHIKNISRKTNSTKRTEILAKLLGVR